MDFSNDFIRQFLSGKVFGGLLGLGNQHPQSIGVGNAEGFGIQQQFGFCRIVDHIQHALQFGKQAQINGGDAGIRIHANRCGVDNDRRIRVTLQIVIVVFPGTGDNDGHRTQIP